MSCVLITGGAKRIGKTLALEFASWGYNIALHYRSNDDSAQNVKSKIEALGVACELYKKDLSNIKEADSLIREVFDRQNDLSVLINNASIFNKAMITETSNKLISSTMDINFVAPFVLSREFYKIVKSGNIINFIDTKSAKNYSKYSIYTLSKKILAEFTKMSALEFAPHIRVNGIAPGLILPPKGEDEAYLDRLAKNIPLQKKGNVSLIVNSIKFLLENDYITGQIIFVDGGQHL